MTDWLADLRPGDGRRSLTEQTVDRDPFAQFRRWLEEARDAGIAQPNAMTLATVDRGVPDARIVLLKALDERGFVFYTHRTSHKGVQLQAVPQAALTFWWDPLERQVRVRGGVEFTTDAESDAYFHSRPRGSQLSAIVSAQSEEVDRQALDQSLADLDAATAGGPLTRPATWGGYRVVPTEFEFWQGRASRLHDRIRFRRSSDTAPWSMARLSP